MNETMPTARPDADYSLGETFSIGLRMAQFDGAAIAASTSSRMGLLWPLLFGVVGGVASPALLNPLAWIPIGFMGAVGFFLLVGYCHLVSQLFGGKGDFDTLIKAAGTASIVRFLSAIPILGYVAVFWYAAILVKVLERVYGYETGTAVAVVALPVIIIIVGSILMFTGVLALGLFGLA